MNKKELEKRKIEYRKKHPNCEWCIWYKSHFFENIGCTTKECQLSEKWINFPKIKAKLCKEYYIEGEDNEI